MLARKRTTATVGKRANSLTQSITNTHTQRHRLTHSTYTYAHIHALTGAASKRGVKVEHATCSILPATCNMQLTTCNTQSATCTQLRSEVCKWNTRDVIRKTPLLSKAVEDGDVDDGFIGAVCCRTRLAHLNACMHACVHELRV